MNDNYNLPGPSIIQSSVDWVIGNGLASAVVSQTKKVRAMGDKVQDYFLNLTTDRSLFSTFPIYRSFENYVDRLTNSSRDFENGVTTLSEAINHMVFLDIDQVLAGKRTKISSAVTAGDVVRRGFRCLSETEVY